MCLAQVVAAVGSMVGASEATIATMQTVGMIVSSVGTVAQGYASMQAANAQADSLEAQADIREFQARQSAQRAGYKSMLIREEARKVQGAQRAGLAGAGLDVNTGTPLDLAVDTAFQSGRDIAMEGYNSQLEQWGFNQEAKTLRSNADASRTQGRNAMIGSVIGAAGSLLTNAGNVSARWSEMNYPMKSTLQGATIPRWMSNQRVARGVTGVL